MGTDSLRVNTEAVREAICAFAERIAGDGEREFKIVEDYLNDHDKELEARELLYYERMLQQLSNRSTSDKLISSIISFLIWP
jgi:hypothetical protein